MSLHLTNDLYVKSNIKVAKTVGVKSRNPKREENSDTKAEPNVTARINCLWYYCDI